MFVISNVLSLFCLILSALALRYDPTHEGWNLNLNQTATDPLDYWGEWENHTFHPSPQNWRIPFYVLTLDRYVDGDPTNNEANGTTFEHDWNSNQFRFGGDAKGMMNNLDYLRGMGVKAVYLSGTPFINMPWSSDGFGALDFTLLDHHHGQIEDWRNLITEMHRRGMYVVLDNTLGTMGDLLQWVGNENTSAPFKWDEYDVRYKSSRQYHDFAIGNDETAACTYPRMWGADGYPLRNQTVLDAMKRPCKDSEFDQYGDMKGVGEVPVEETQLAKFAGVQDRLRTWRDDVLDKVMHFSCMQIAMLDIDGFRMDKAAQTPIDVHARWSAYQRECATRYNKTNFLIVGEIVSKVPYASLIIGRGKEPNMAWPSLEAAVRGDTTNSTSFIRERGMSALDGDAFMYPFYGAMTRFLGLDGPIGLEGVDFVEIWNELLLHEDFTNAYTGEFDPRHLWGMTNQDVFRWPGLANGTQKHLLGLFLANMMMPGAPFQLWGEEQESYILENQASDYIFGRTPMASQRAWQMHGCYKLGAEVYVDMPFEKAMHGCQDDSVSLDHRDPSHFMRNILKRQYELRDQYQVLNDGVHLQTLSTQHHDIYLPGSLGMPSPTGIWSVHRSAFPNVQDFSSAGALGNQDVWIVYSNENRTMNFTFNCQNQTEGLIAPFPAGTTVKSLFFPYEEITLGTSAAYLNTSDSYLPNGCLGSYEMAPWGHKLFVPKEKFAEPRPTITRVIPGHDQRLISQVPDGEPQAIPIEVHFSSEMDCENVVRNFSIRSTTGNGQVARLNTSSVTCSNVALNTKQDYVSQIGTAWIMKGKLENVYDGIHVYTLNNVSSQSKSSYTQAVDHFMFRIGQSENPMIFPMTSNYSSSLLHRNDRTGALTVTHKATGADKWQYTLNWGATWSEWRGYTPNASLVAQPWSGTKDQAWEGEHVMIRYWSEMAGSMEHVQHGDVGFSTPRRWPHMHVTGPWNLYGFDAGLPDKMQDTGAGQWHFDMMTEYPSTAILSTWGINPDGQPDKSKMYGDVDLDGVLDWLPPTSLGKNVINITNPGMPYTGVRIIANDGDLRYTFEPTGSAWRQLAISILLALVPLFTGALAIYLFRKSFYDVKFNELGLAEKNSSRYPTFAGAMWKKSTGNLTRFTKQMQIALPAPERQEGFAMTHGSRRSTVLLATMEYDIEDWKLKVKIGGLGVMASLMGKNLQHKTLIWVVPCVGDLEYPIDQPSEPMEITILGQLYSINVQYHRYQNITFVLLDAPVFRAQTKSDPYPARMDDMESAVFYSSWNQCIAETMRRFPEIDIYHINDYHGTLAPLYMLPDRAPPCCLSLHNAEFQGLWSIKRSKDMDEICRVFNLNKDIVTTYVQFGEVFNLLHAGASYLRIHQRGYGAVGVSKKYGKRSFARYPIFWGLSKIGSLPNPDPSDTAPWSKNDKITNCVAVDPETEAGRGLLRTQAQEWAGLQVDPDAELFVFVGRWSQQKGVDLIADVFPSILEKNPKAQLICIGPVIDLYGKFAALKLHRLMEIYPDRVCSKPEFTVLPPCIFSGAEFALIPSRDEPFGLVAVEFGRKGALGVGSRVGGLGQMPGWWFTIESVATKHLVRQFQSAINAALASSQETRAEMRARSSLQRFPVAQWVEGLEKLHAGSIHVHQRITGARASVLEGVRTPSILSPLPSAPGTALNSPMATRPSSRMGSRMVSRVTSRTSSPIREEGHGDETVQPHPPSVRPNRSHTRLPALLNLDSTVASSSATPANGTPTATTPTGHFSGFPLFPIPSVSYEEENYGYFSSQDQRQNLAQHSMSPKMSRRNSHDSNDSLSSSSEGRRTTSHESHHTHSSLPDSDRSRHSSRHWSARPSVLSLESVVGDEKNYRMQNVEPFFTDSQGVYTKQFGRLLDGLNGRTSTNELCIEEFIVKSEKNWFSRFYDAKLGVKSASSKVTAIRETEFDSSDSSQGGGSSNRSIRAGTVIDDEFQLGSDFTPARGIKKLVQYKIRDWPIFAFFIALGQILSANSYQITLLTGEQGQTANKLYVIASIYLAASVFWWTLFRTLQSRYVIALPFICYGLAFFILGMAPYASSFAARGWVQNVATGIYALASGSGSLFFALNFGSEGGTATHTWVFRACAVQGTQQIYVTVLWYWGSHLASVSASGSNPTGSASSPYITTVTTPIALLLCTIAFLLFLGLPDFYRSSPGSVPSFYASLRRRKIILWFFLVVVIQNYFLSAPYGRNWQYLWSSSLVPTWSIVILVLVFFVLVWIAVFTIFNRLSIEHSWILPIFAIGLGAPRWAQMLWGTSGMGLFVPWAGTPAIGALLGRSLWLWLGVLDALQGVGFGMVLLQTMTRFHVAFTLCAAQVVGSLATIAARATAPDRVGPGAVFPNLALGLDGLGSAVFWVALALQGVVCVGFFAFFRKEQLFKP
ncbi:hypothetical protein CC80DRAFT_526600 [Byssothecium circinans]|uniref:alpha-1,3-glucan synthase n=1 Tax=Byssothecium circinans TaxID=147558 RepID=A0A6A5TPN8_9PLEO|nr:hypothetical protein CC80DRAFT_526600 [Byssothecium circinans]